LRAAYASPGHPLQSCHLWMKGSMRGHRHDVPMTGSLLPIPTTGSKAVGSGGNRTRNHHSQRSGGRLLFLQGRMHTRAPKSARLNVLSMLLGGRNMLRCPLCSPWGSPYNASRRSCSIACHKSTPTSGWRMHSVLASCKSTDPCQCGLDCASDHQHRVLLAALHHALQPSPQSSHSDALLATCFGSDVPWPSRRVPKQKAQQTCWATRRLGHPSGNC
jgi:hypothetical protein